jgi:imidazolonepropionase-like amidohydrolase
MKKILFTTLLILLSGQISAQTTIIQADGYVDVASGELITPARILVENGIITSINPASLPDDAESIDLSGSILLPGFMDMHAHLTIDFDDFFRNIIGTESGSKGAIRGAKNARKTLMAGFTTVRDLGQLHITDELVNVAVAEAVDEGWIEGPRIIAAGHMISITGGHGDLSSFFTDGFLELSPEYGIIDSPDEAVAATRYQIKHGAKVIKMHATAGVMSPEESVGAHQLSDAEMRAIIQEAARHEIPVAAHAHGTEGIKAAIRAGVSSIEHGSILDQEAIQMMIDNEVFLVPTTGPLDLVDLESLPPQNRKKAEYVYPLAKEGLKNAIEAGVKIALGTDTPILPHGENAYEIIAMVNRGMTPAQSLRSATMIPAELVGMQNELGQIKEGMLADIVAVRENPLERIETVEELVFVMKEGVVYKRER